MSEGPFEAYFDGRDRFQPHNVVTMAQILKTVAEMREISGITEKTGVAFPSFQERLSKLPDMKAGLPFALALTDYDVSEKGDIPLIIINMAESRMLSLLFEKEDLAISYKNSPEPTYAHLSLGENKEIKCFILTSFNISFPKGTFFYISSGLKKIIGNNDAIIKDISQPPPRDTDTLIFPKWKL